MMTTKITESINTQLDVELHPLKGCPLGSCTEVEKQKFLIIVSGSEVEARRSKPRELIGYVSKKPGKPISFLPVANAFKDAIPEITVAVHASVMLWRQSRIDALMKNLSDANALSPKNDADVATKQMAVQAAQAALDAAVAELGLEANSERTYRLPDAAKVKEYVQELDEIATDNSSDVDTEADAQNL